MSDSDQVANDDFEYTRQVYHDLISKGTDALDDMMEVARMSEHPRAFEVLSTMIKSIADVNGDLLDLHKKKKDLHKKDIKALPQGTTNNNLFVGSTTDLQKMLQQVNETPDDNVIDITSRLNDDESK